MPAPPPPIRHRSFPAIVDPATRLLVLGSLPGVASLQAGRYYAHPQNQFWRLLGAAIHRDLAAMPYEERLDALRAAKVGLWDMVAEAHRPGSLDSAIRDVASNDLAALAASLPDLRALAFNGAIAARLAMRQYPDAAARYRLFTLPSSSPAFTRPFALKRAEWDRLGDVLCDD